MFARTIPPSVFARRRCTLMERMVPVRSPCYRPPLRPHATAISIILPSGQRFLLSDRFSRAGSDRGAGPGGEQEFLLFCRERDLQMEIWHGRRAGPRRGGALRRRQRHPMLNWTSCYRRCWKTASGYFMPSATTRISTDGSWIGSTSGPWPGPHRSTSTGHLHCPGTPATRHAAVQGTRGNRGDARIRPHRL